ncbi:sulfotransferase [Xanthomonas translucens pv. arrhenatheri]|uniref:Sulfotransferase RaxST n=3 Tax=Xanthomonas graminis TaxID=3390026 RepID=A0A1M4INU1_9XANT|nr:RiPP modification sulfotransferase RaxST [Xanthomonas translucens]EKU23877.1 putative sulfotransferase RaxST [Xanthomonas translucens pv. graminis ART-Xtg29]OAX58272.1 sulfotransferase [Xanthomonas translucens pv. graminis]OAX64891.1 sulfotransferase [Xanthomonas translucens pv. arrhenatheri]UKE55384.1 RiPP modification sulfotransferase RaxST [Xanthomonas translucens pv. graminis]UKE63027.1 RiPP modification sulfotransferase RaxST [Xanthomonas translucens pv. poae]
MDYHFISGLPRSGSSLLAALLRQNPRVHAEVTSPLARLYAAMLMGMSEEYPSNVQLDDAQRARLLRGIFDAFYQDRQQAQWVFDTNRAWCSRLPALATLFPDTRIVCCVREVGWIVDSFERLAQAQPLRLSALFGYDPEDSLSMRADLLTGARGVLGYALDGLRQAVYGDHAERLLLLRYETLARHPAQAMEQVYAFLQMPAFAHDYANLEGDAARFDAALQTPGLHRVRRTVGYVPRRSVLPPELFERLQQLAFWETEPLPGVRIV